MIITEMKNGQMDNDHTEVTSKPAQVIESVQISAPIKEPVKSKIRNIFQKKAVQTVPVSEMSSSEGSIAKDSKSIPEDPPSNDQTPPTKVGKSKNMFGKKAAKVSAADQDIEGSGVISLAMASMTIVGIEKVELVEAERAPQAKPKGFFQKGRKTVENSDLDMESAVTSLSVASVSVVRLEQDPLDSTKEGPPTKTDKFMNMFKKKERDESPANKSDDNGKEPELAPAEINIPPNGEIPEKSKPNKFRNLFGSKSKSAKSEKIVEDNGGLEITDEDIDLALNADANEKMDSDSVVNILKKRHGGSSKDLSLSSLTKSESTDSLRSGSDKSESVPFIKNSKLKAKESPKNDKPKSNLKNLFSKNKIDPSAGQCHDDAVDGATVPDDPKESIRLDAPNETSNKFTNLFSKKKKDTPQEGRSAAYEILNDSDKSSEEHTDPKSPAEKAYKEKESLFSRKKKSKEKEVVEELVDEGKTNEGSLDPVEVETEKLSTNKFTNLFSKKKKDTPQEDRQETPDPELTVTDSEHSAEREDLKEIAEKPQKPKTGLFGKKKKESRSELESKSEGTELLDISVVGEKTDESSLNTIENPEKMGENAKEIKEKNIIFSVKKKPTKDIKPSVESLEILDNKSTEDKLTTKEKSNLTSFWSFANKKKQAVVVEGSLPELNSMDELKEQEVPEEEPLEPLKPKRKTSTFRTKNKKKDDHLEEETVNCPEDAEPDFIRKKMSKDDQHDLPSKTESRENLIDDNKDDEEPSESVKAPKEKSRFFTIKKKKVPEESLLTAANSIDCLEAGLAADSPIALHKSTKDQSGFFHKKNKSEADLITLAGEDELEPECPLQSPVDGKTKRRKVSIFHKKRNRPAGDEGTQPGAIANNALSSSSYELDHEVMDFTPLTLPGEAAAAKSDKPKSKLKAFSDMMVFASTRPLKRMEPLALADTSAKDTSRNEDNEMEVPEDRMLLEDSQSAAKLLNETLEPSSESNITIEEQMQLLCDLFGHKEDVIWDSYTPNQREALKNKLKLVLDPETKSKKKNIDKFINDMTDTIWNQSKYSDGVLNMSIIFVALLNEKELDVRKAKNFTLRPVFRTTKCVDKESKSSRGCCMIFIDESGRVYRNWDHFIVENTYEPSIIVAPSRGIFNTDTDGKVSMEFFTAPSSSVGAKLLSITDKTATVTGLGASACFIGGMLTVALLPVAAPAIGIAMAGAGLVGAASAGYSMVRSTQKMKDMSEHEKSLKITDAEARGHWLGLIGGMTGFVSGVAAHGIDILARGGYHIPAFFRGSIDAINAASIAVNGVGVIDGFSTMFLKWNEEKISTMEIMQLSASLFMFTHSMYNFETANSIIKNHHNMTVNEFRDKLGQNQRHHYHKMAKESLKVHGKGHHDVIRSLRAIPDQQEFHKLHKAENVITEGMATAATLLVAKFCKSYFVVDENDLQNTILNAMALLSDHAFDVFVDVVERFVECKGHLVQKSLRGIISFEEVMSDILASVTSISESLGLDVSEFIETLTKTESFLSPLIDRIYDIYKDYERVEPNQTCAECKGVFTVKTSASSKSAAS